MFHTLDQFKAAAEFFPCGRIVPQRILKGPRRIKHKVKFGADCWLFQNPLGVVIFAETSSPNSNGAIIRTSLATIRGMSFVPYSAKGVLRWIPDQLTGRAIENEENILKIINRHLK